MLYPKNQAEDYNSFFAAIEKGEVKLPMFQRDFVWDKEQTAKLLDSILKGFPIGTFIFWRTQDELRSYKNIGNHALPKTPKGNYASYVLDGQQRITSLYAVRAGLRLTKDGKEIDYKDISVDLDYDEKHDDQIVLSSPPASTRSGSEEDAKSFKSYISVHDVLTRKTLDLFDDGYSREQIERIDTYKTRLTSYSFSTISITDYPIEVACEIFARINTSGKSLTIFEVMVAKTYDEQRKFDLAERYEALRDGEDGAPCLREAKFDTIPEVVVMQCIAACAIRGVRSRDILKIKRETFIDNWSGACSSLLEAVDFVRSQLRIPVSQMLPYPSMMVPLAYWFNKNSNKKPTARQRTLLEQWFYWVGLNYRYSSASETKIVEDFERMDAILKGEMPQYPPAELTFSPEEIGASGFSAGDSWCKTVLCLLAFQQPKSFDTNGLVILDNSNLKIAASRNYHHFFPKAYLATKRPLAQPNLMMNITLIDGYSNKHLIGKKAPSTYIREFKKANGHLDETLKSHCISDIEKFGINENEYDTFIAERSKIIARKLNTKLRGPA